MTPSELDRIEAHLRALPATWELRKVGDALAALRADVARLTNALAKEEKAHGKTIDERDAAEQAISQAYYLVIGVSPEWSNNFGVADALEAIDDAQRTLRLECADVARLTADIEQLSEHCATISENAALAEVERYAAVRDAERYRWLRDVGDKTTWQAFRYREGYGASECDDAIDADIAASKPAGEGK